jgi:hypothetical protein
MVWGGYNETGFAIINSAAYNNNLGDTTSFQDQEGVVMKLALQTCRTLEDFENLLRSLPKPLGVDANFGIIDASGGAAYYETGNFRFVKFDVNDPEVAPEGILIRTNHSMSSDIKKGFGFSRYNTAAGVLLGTSGKVNFTPAALLNNISRNLFHSLTGTDLAAQMPERKEPSQMSFFIDYIPRRSTASVMMIVGARNEKRADETMMWSILGFPLTSVAVPVWITNDGKLPLSVSPNDSLKAPLCNAALEFKKNCFPMTYGEGNNYINLAAVINRENSGYMQKAIDIEKVIFEKAGALVSDPSGKSRSEKNIGEFYLWLDKYLEEQYLKVFGHTLFEK